MPWGLEVAVLDPFANRIVFHQLVEEAEPTEGGGSAAGPIEHEYAVACSPGHAFNVFTLRIAEWWHPAYAPPGLADVVVGRSVGDGCYMKVAEGSAYQWGTTTTWERHHFAMDFTLAQDPHHPSRIDVRFDEAPFGKTRMRFSHGGWTAGNVAGRARFSEWPILLDRFAALAEGRELPPGKPEDEST
jgi:hypothetical protein